MKCGSTGLGYPFRARASTIHAYGIVAVPLLYHMRRLFAGHSFPFLSAVYNYFLFRSVLCLRFFPPLLVPNDCTSVKYASGYFSILSAPCLLARLSCITQSVFARAFSYFVFPVSCSRVSWIGHPPL